MTSWCVNPKMTFFQRIVNVFKPCSSTVAPITNGGVVINNQLSDAESPLPGSGNSAMTSVVYDVDSVPPWYMCVMLGFQHYLTMVGGMIAVPLIISSVFCFQGDWVATSEIFATMFFVSGISTLIQGTFGTRLPIIQGMSFAFVQPAAAILSLSQWKCPTSRSAIGNETSTDITNISTTTMVAEEVPWKSRMREIQGAVIVASFGEVLIGLTGLVGLLLRFIGPLTVAPIITILGISLFSVAADYCAHNWWIAFLTMALVTIFSQHMQNINIPFCFYSNGTCRKSGYPLLRLFPVILAIAVSWIVCAILTAADVIPDDRQHWAYQTRTDTKTYVLEAAQCFRVPYPFQWGMPTFSAAAVLGMMTAIVSSIVESVGDYYACARISGAILPPTHAINRGICVEGIGCVLAGAFGTGCGVTSYSENIGAIGITSVASRRVVLFSAVIMIVLGVLGKFGALFVTIPEPIVGGLFIIMFGMVSAVGISNLQYVDMNSPRNIFIFGFSVLIGISLPQWIQKHPDVIATGVSLIDQIVTVLAMTGMFVGGLLAIILDNTIPGTAEERGLKSWQPVADDVTACHGNGGATMTSLTPPRSTYDLPFIMSALRRWTWTKYVPISPTFTGFRSRDYIAKQNLAQQNSSSLAC